MSPDSKEQTPLPRLDNGTYDVAPKTDWQKSIVERNALNSPLLRLPRELRDLIWTLVSTQTIKPMTSEPSQYSPFNILVVCRQTYTEAVGSAYPLLTWSFSSLPSYEDFFWRVHDSKWNKSNKNSIHSMQIGVDASDLYMLAEWEDPGTDEEEGEDDYHRPTFRAFEQLERLELLLSATGVFDAEDEDEEDAGMVHVPRYDDVAMEEAKLNFCCVVERKIPRVSVTYREFGDSLAMKKYWRKQDSWGTGC